jgi:ankyrin repeat protein
MRRTPLLEAVYIIKDIESIKMLIQGGCDVNVEDWLGYKALCYANMGNDERVVKMLLDAEKEGKKELSKIGEGYKNIKPRDVYKEMMKEIESKGINEKNKDGETVLHLAVQYENIEKIKELIEKGADINIGDNKGRKVLHYAALFGKTKTVKVLIEKGANINATDNSRYVPLHLACLKGAIGVARVLVKAGADINALDKFGHSPLYHAKNKKELVKLLEKSGGKFIDKFDTSLKELMMSGKHHSTSRKELIVS